MPPTPNAQHAMPMRYVAMLPCWVMLFCCALWCINAPRQAAASQQQKLGVYTLEVMVKRTGSPVSGATVVVKGPGNMGGSLTTGGDGVVSFTFGYKGAYTVVVSHPDFESSHTVVNLTGRSTTCQLNLHGGASRMRLAVTVLDDKGAPISGAHVDTRSGTGIVYDRHMSTDDAGIVYILVDATETDSSKSDRFIVTVSHPDFESKTGYVVAQYGVKRDYACPFHLSRKGGLLPVRVTLVEAGTNAPIQGATVTLDAGSMGVYSEASDGDGLVSINVKGGAIYRMSITSTNYEALSDKVDLVGSSATGFDETYELAPKSRAARRVVQVIVRGKAADGSVKPLEGARVTVGFGNSAYHSATDASGAVKIFHNIPSGEEASVSVSADGYMSGSDSVMIGARGTPGRNLKSDGKITAIDSVSLILLREGASAILHVEVREKSPSGSGKPLSGAHVSMTGAGSAAEHGAALNISGRQLSGSGAAVMGVTDGSGHVELHHTFAKGEDMQVSVSLPGFAPATRSIAVGSTGTFGTSGRGGAAGRTIDDLVVELARGGYLSGQVAPDKGRVKLDEFFKVAVGYSYESGTPGEARVQETMELVGPKGNVIQSFPRTETLESGAYSRRLFNVDCQEPGTYTIRASVRGDGIPEWSGSAKVTVLNEHDASLPKGGYFKLVKTEIGHAAPPDRGWSGSIGQNNATINAVGNGHSTTLTVTYSTPPLILKPDSTITLTGDATVGADVAKIGGLGATAEWGGSGSCTLVGQKGDAGMGSGKYVASGHCEYTVKIGRGKEIYLYTKGRPDAYGSGGNWICCQYWYSWVTSGSPAPTAPAGAKTTITPISGK